MMESRRGSRLAIDDEVAPVALPAGKRTSCSRSSPIKLSSGRLVWRDLVLRPRSAPCAAPCVDLRGSDVDRLGEAGADGGVVMFLVGLVMAIPKDPQRARARRHGRRLKGPELVSAPQFNRRTRADGIWSSRRPSLPAKPLWPRSCEMPRAVSPVTY